MSATDGEAEAEADEDGDGDDDSIEPNSMANSDSEDLAQYDFYFESDHLALRGNTDYRNVLRTLVILEAQRTHILKNLKELVEAKTHYVLHPQKLIDKLKHGEPLVNAQRIEIAEVPKLKLTDIFPQPMARDESDDHMVLVRGRLMDESKPATFNKLWTYEEQRRLEELLIVYPPEPVEAHRYAKIAKALGNRTPQQVTSRCQKYFLKLTDAGLPVPGRKLRGRRFIHHKLKRFYRPTTFFPNFKVPRYMDDDDSSNESGSIPSTQSYDKAETEQELATMKQELATIKQEPNSDEESDADAEEDTKPEINAQPQAEAVADSAASSDNDESMLSHELKERMVDLLEVVREEKLNQSDEAMKRGPMCDRCTTEPCMRARWRCHTCSCTIYRCGNCLIDELVQSSFPHMRHKIVRLAT